jgi:peptide/nickel transport system substrate-binding protein
MKRLLLFLMALMLMAGFAFATPAVAGKKDVLVIGMPISDIISLDPAKAFEFSGVGIEVQMYDRLLDFPAGKFDIPEMSLAESVKVSDDGRTFTFKLKQGVKFHSGNEMTADDVVYSFTRVVSLKDQPSFILTQFGITPESLKAVDKYTVSVTLDKKYASGIFYACLSAGVASIVDSKVVKQHVKKTDKYPKGDFGLTWLSRNSAGSGPFKLVSWEKNDKVVLNSFPGHFKNPPHVKRVIIKEINEAASRRLQVEKGDIDIAWELQADQVKALEGHKELKVYSVPAMPIYYLAMNVKEGPLSKAKVRKAIRYAIDYDGLINDIMSGAATPINTFIPAGFAGYTDKIIYKRDVAKGKKLMQEAGYANGFEVELDHGDQTPFPECAQFIQNSLAAIGIKVKLNKLVSSQLWPKYRAQKHQLLLARWGPDYIDPHTNAQPFADYKAKQLCWRNVYYNDETSAMIQKASQEMDNAKRIAIYQKVNDIIQEDGPYAFILQPMYEHAVRNNIEGFYASPSFDLWKLYPIKKK